MSTIKYEPVFNANDFSSSSSSSSTKPAGSDTYVQYNKNGAFGADSSFYFNRTTKALYATSLNLSSDLTVAGQVLLSNLTSSTTGNVLYFNSSNKKITYGSIPNTSSSGSSGAVQLSNGSNGFTSNSNLSFSGDRLNTPSISATQGESQFSNGNYDDPDSGVSRAVKISGDGLAVSGGTKTDWLHVSSNTIYNGSGLTMLDDETVYFPAVNSRACIYPIRGTISNSTSAVIPIPVRNPQQFMFGICNTIRTNFAHCLGYVYNPSGAPSLLVNGSSPRISAGTQSFAGQTYAAIVLSNLNGSYTYKTALYIFELPDE